MLSSRDLPDPGIEPESLMSLALAGRFFTPSAAWEALILLGSICRGISASLLTCLTDKRQQEEELQTSRGAAFGHLIEALRRPEDS